MRIVIGLGNPGRDYALTRHNLGFIVADEVARRAAAGGFRKRFKSDIAEGMLGSERVVLVKPQTFMNLSGHAAREVIGWFHAPVEDVLLIVDELDLPFGELRVRASGSAGGHKGIRSVTEQLGTQAVPRLRIGIGRGQGRISAESHVLARFTEEEAAELPSVIEEAAEAVICWVADGITACMNRVNQRAPTAS